MWLGNGENREIILLQLFYINTAGTINEDGYCECILTSGNCHYRKNNIAVVTVVLLIVTTP